MMLPAPVFAQENAASSENVTSSSEYFTFEIYKKKSGESKLIFPTADGSPFADSMGGLFDRLYHYEMKDFWLKVHADMTGYVAALNLLGEDFTDQPRQKCQASFAVGPLKPLPWRAMDEREVLEHYAKQAAIINYSLGVIGDYDSLPAGLSNPKWIKNENPQPPGAVTNYLKYPFASFPYMPAEIASDPTQKKIQRYVGWSIVFSFPESERPKHLDLRNSHDSYGLFDHVTPSYKITGDGPRRFGNAGQAALAARLIVDWDYSRALAMRLTELGRGPRLLYAAYLQQLASQGMAASFLQLFSERHRDYSTGKRNILWERSLPLFERGDLRWDVIKGVEGWPFISDAVPSDLKQAGIRVDLFRKQRRAGIKYYDEVKYRDEGGSPEYVPFSKKCTAPVFVDNGYYYMFVQTDEAGLETPLLWSKFIGGRAIHAEGVKLEEDYIQAGNVELAGHFFAKVKIGEEGITSAEHTYFAVSHDTLLRSPHGVLYRMSTYLNREAHALSDFDIWPLIPGGWGGDRSYVGGFSLGRDDHLEDVIDLRAFALGQGVSTVSPATKNRGLLVPSHSKRMGKKIVICAEKEGFLRNLGCSKRP